MAYMQSAYYRLEQADWSLLRDIPRGAMDNNGIEAILQRSLSHIVRYILENNFNKLDYMYTVTQNI